MRDRRTSLDQAVIPVALLALVALVGGLVYHTRRLEASHRATAENALRDYAGLAAWHYNQQAENYLVSTAWNTLNHLQTWFRGTTKPLPPPSSLVSFGDTGACGLGRWARFAFRVDLPKRSAAFAGQAPGSVARAGIVQRLATLARRERKADETVGMLIDTIGGATRAIAYAILRGPDSVPRAVYGVEADPARLVPYLRDIPATKPLLPPSLLRGRSTDSLLLIQVQRADGASLASIGLAAAGDLAAEQTMSEVAGGLITRVVLRPEAAATLLIGGLPPSRLNMLLVLLGGSIILAGIALLQIRRGRDLTRLRARFVANVSHELRTPLAQISMFSETLLLSRERSREEGKEFLSVIFREARRLSHLVETVLRFSRAEAQTASRPLRLIPRDVGLELHDAVRGFEPLAAAAGVELRTALEDGCVARMEPGALRQMVLNLLDNAVKFGPKGQQVTLSVARIGADVVIAVTDQGPGIPEGERTRVFQPFAQGTSSLSRTTTGAGIGLAVVADLVAAHGGRVWIEDAPAGHGARVAIALPALLTSATVVPEAANSPSDRDAALAVS
jgi:signal transduction histidine kinase